MLEEAAVKPHRVCPWWLGYLLASSLRKLWQDPREILAPFVREGQKVLEPDRNRPVPASVTGLLQAIVTGLPIVTGPPQLIVIGPLRAIAMDPA